MKKPIGSRIEALIEAEKWSAARQAIRAKLRSSPDDHWLLTRLGLTYYEEKRYKQALRYSVRALEKMPHCPLVLWDYAGTLEMLGQTRPMGIVARVSHGHADSLRTAITGWLIAMRQIGAGRWQSSR